MVAAAGTLPCLPGGLQLTPNGSVCEAPVKEQSPHPLPPPLPLPKRPAQVSAPTSRGRPRPPNPPLPRFLFPESRVWARCDVEERGPWGVFQVWVPWATRKQLPQAPPRHPTVWEWVQKRGDSSARPGGCQFHLVGKWTR